MPHETTSDTHTTCSGFAALRLRRCLPKRAKAKRVASAPIGDSKLPAAKPLEVRDPETRPARPRIRIAVHRTAQCKQAPKQAKAAARTIFPMVRAAASCARSNKRTGRDSNPRYRDYPIQQFSKLSPSASRAPVRGEAHYTHSEAAAAPLPRA